jgi:hypothetical protein
MFKYNSTSLLLNNLLRSFGWDFDHAGERGTPITVT